MNIKLRNTVLIVATVVTVLCVILGLFINSDNFERFLKNKDNQRLSFGGKSYAYEESFDGDITDIVINLDMASVEIKEGNENKLSIDANKAVTPIYSFENGTLTLSAKEAIKITPFGKNPPDIVITVDGDIDSFDAQIDMGSIEISGVEIKDCNVAVDMGEIEASDSKIENVSAKVDLGNIEFDKVDFLSGALECRAGDIEVSLPFGTDEYSLDISVELGNIEMGDDDMGTRFQSSNGMRSLSATVDMGSVEIK